ncbi:MAG: hypothetical protein HUJ83_05960 [Veillonella sp.]|nr:hypothetical protein [Veillonella sp.]
MLNRTQYKIKAKYTPTNRFRTITVWAKSEKHAIELITNQEYEEIASIEIDFDSPTQAQLDYARALGIHVADTDTKIDVSCLIDKKLYRASDPNPELIEFADNRDIVFSYHVSKKGLYNLVFSELPDLDKIAFFIFTVYRYYSGDRTGNMDKSIHRHHFYEFANNTINNTKLVKSLLENYHGSDLRFFGPLNAYGETLTGGSRATIIFKSAKAFLIEKSLLSESDFSNHKSVSGFKNKELKETSESISIYRKNEGVNIYNAPNTTHPHYDKVISPTEHMLTDKGDTVVGCGCLVFILIVFLWLMYLIF